MFSHLFLDIDAGTIDWSRAQFALTAIYHWLFVPLTLGLAVIMGIVETKYYQTKDVFWRDAAKFWQKLFGVNFAMGVATGIILEFEFGTNWSNYSWFVGDIFGAPLAIEGIVAFFMESTFVAVMYFGWKKVSSGFHLASTWLTGLGATISAWWILVANAWMQYPVGCEFNPDTMRNEMVSFFEVALSPFAISKFCHTVTSAWIIGAVFCVGVCCWYLLKKRETKLAIESLKIGAAVGLVASLLAAATGHKSGMDVAKVQPMKLAAMEALYNGGVDQGLTAIALINPFAQPDYANGKSAPLKIEMPYALSMMATNDPHGFVPGVNDILNGYTTPDGHVEPSADEKIAMGKKATCRTFCRRKDRNGQEGHSRPCSLSQSEKRRRRKDSSHRTGDAEGQYEVFRLWLYPRQVGACAIHPHQFLGLPHHGRYGMSVYSLLCCHPGRRLSVPQRTTWEVRHHSSTRMALLVCHRPHPTGLHCLGEWMACG